MKITIKATNIELTSALRSHIEEKIGSLQHFIEKYELEGEREVFVEVGRTSAHHHKGDVFRAEVTLELPGAGLRAEETNADLYAAVLRAKDVLKIEIQKYKDRHAIDKKKIAEA